MIGCSARAGGARRGCSTASRAVADAPKPLTPAPFQGTSPASAVSDEFQSFAWGSAVGADTDGAATAPPPLRPYTPPPPARAPAVPDTPVVGQPTPSRPGAVPPPAPPAPPAPEPAAAEEDPGFMTFGAPAPAPPTDALVPPPAQDEAPPAEAMEPPPAEAPTVEEPAEGSGFETYVAPPPLRPPTSEPEAAPAPETVAPPEPPPALPEPPVEAAPPIPEPVAVTPAPVPVPPAPEPVPAEPQVAATVMPDAVQNSLITPAPPVVPPRERKQKPERERKQKPEREREAGPKRNLFPVLVVAGAVLAAIVGFLAGGSGGSKSSSRTRSGGTPTVVAASPDVKAKVPSGWSKLGSAPAVPGMDLAEPVAFTPGGKGGGDLIEVGAVRKSADNSTLLSTGLIKAAGTLPAKEAVEVSGGIQGYRYRDLKLSGFSRPVTVFAVPTSAGVATLACVGAQATCDASINTMQLVSAKAFPVGPSSDYAKAVGAALGTLGKATKSGQAQLASAPTPKAQASAANGLSAAYSKAAKALGACR